MPAEVFLVSGIPGAGKTTVAHALAQRFDRGVHIEGDLVGHHFIVTGLVAPDWEPKEEAERQIDLRRRNIRLLADSFADAGFVTVIDDVVVSSRVLDLYRKLNGSIRFVQLSPGLEVVRTRDMGRDKHVFEIWKHLDDQRRAWPHPQPGLWLDTTELHPDETVEAIMDRSDEALIL